MSVAALINRPCTVTRRADSGEADDYGNPIQGDTDVATVCELQKFAQPNREEPGTEGELSDTLWTLFLPAGTVIRTGDAVTVDGDAYEMVGDPWHVRNPTTGVESHVEATVRRTTGSGDA